MIEKKDWENALKQYESMLINASINIAAYGFMIDSCNSKIKEFPDEKKEEMPKELKEIIKEATS